MEGHNSRRNKNDQEANKERIYSEGRRQACSVRRRVPRKHGAHVRAPPARCGAVGAPRSVGVGFGAQPRLKRRRGVGRSPT